MVKMILVVMVLLVSVMSMKAQVKVMVQCKKLQSSFPALTRQEKPSYRSRLGALVAKERNKTAAPSPKVKEQ